jgi:hypothetical protein
MRNDLRRQLDTVLRMASTGFDTLKEVVVRSSQEGRLRVDLALLQREKRELLEQLGGETLRLLDSGELEGNADLDWLRDRIHDVESRMRASASRAHDNAYGAPRGFEPEAGNYEDVQDDLDDSEPEADEAR